MQQQLKGNKMKKKSKKVTPPKSIKDSLDSIFQKKKKNRNIIDPLLRPDFKQARAYYETIKENPKAIKRFEEQIKKRKAQNKNIGGILTLLASDAAKKKRKTGSDAMKAKGMTPADRMSEGGQMVKSKRTRSIDGLATRGKTRGTQR
tara:strand:- start:2377 stop:2817 length:441 start_codon:yes stop_codon:yes gene_type:complete